jgi:hypothetical protein
MVARFAFSEFASPNAEQPVERAKGHSGSDKRYDTEPSPGRLGTHENQCNEHEADNGTEDSVDGSDVFATATHVETPFAD